MDWYSMFRRPQEKAGTPLYCQTKTCHKLIKGDAVLYDIERHTIHHSHECYQQFIAREAFRTGSIVTGDLRPLSRAKALELLEQGKLQGSLEEKVTS